MVKINRLQIQQHKQQQQNPRTPIKKAKKKEITLIEPPAATSRPTATIIINIDIKRTGKTSRLTVIII